MQRKRTFWDDDDKAWVADLYVGAIEHRPKSDGDLDYWLYCHLPGFKKISKFRSKAGAIERMDIILDVFYRKLSD